MAGYYAVLSVVCEAFLNIENTKDKKKKKAVEMHSNDGYTEQWLSNIPELHIRRWIKWPISHYVYFTTMKNKIIRERLWGKLNEKVGYPRSKRHEITSVFLKG